MDKSFKLNVWIGVGIIAGGILLFFLLGAYLSGRIEGKSDAIAADRLVIAKRAELFANLAELKNRSAEVAKYRQKIDALLPSKDQLFSFPQTLNGLAIIHKISLNFSFKGAPIPPKTDFPGTANFSMDMNGSLENIALFLDDVEINATRFLIGVDSFDLVNISGTEYRLSAQARVFFK